MGGLALVVRQGTKELAEQQKVAAQTTAALKSTGGAAGVTAKQIDALALSLSNLSGIDDEVIKSGENVLLSFTNIRNAAGKGNDIFDQATKAVVDFAVRTGRDVPAAALVLGKALADPVRRLSSLARAGVVFTKSQEEAVKAAVKTGGVMAGQKILLQELAKRYGGAAKAAGKTLPGQLAVLRERFNDLSASIIVGFVPAVTKGVTALTGFVRRLSAAKGFRAKFEVIFEGVESSVRNLVDALRNQVQTALRAIDWRDAGREVSNGLARALTSVADSVRRIDWEQIGSAIVRGIIDFLKGVDWVALFKGIVRLWVAALKAQAKLLLGIGKELGGAIISGVTAALRSAGSFLAEQALKIVDRILGAFDFLGRFNPFKGLRAKVKAELTKMEADAQAATRSIQRSIDGIKGKRVTVEIETVTTARVAEGKDALTIARSGGAQKKIKDQARKVEASTVQAVNSVVQAQERTATTLEKEAVAAESAADRARAALERIQRAQFLALGFTAEGQRRGPGTAALKKALGSLKSQIKGTFLDTSKTQAELARIAKVLSGAYGKVGREVRLAIQQMLSDINTALKDSTAGAGAAKITKDRIKDPKFLLQGLGLTEEQRRELRTRIIGGRVGSGTQGADGRARSPVAGFGGGLAGAIIINGPITVKADDPESFIRAMQKKGKKGAPSRRGRHGGVRLGLG